MRERTHEKVHSSSTVKKLEHPFTLEQVRTLRVGDAVSLSGLVFTGRDRLHRHLAEGGKCPVELRDGARPAKAGVEVA